MESDAQDSIHSQIAFFYRDERTLQYFFVCYRCSACYETTDEIINHVDFRCRKTVNNNRNYIREDITEKSPILQYQPPTTLNDAKRDDECIVIDVEEEINFTQEQQPIIVAVSGNIPRGTSPSDAIDDTVNNNRKYVREGITEKSPTLQCQPPTTLNDAKRDDECIVIDVDDEISFIQEQQPIIVAVSGNISTVTSPSDAIDDTAIIDISVDETVNDPCVTSLNDVIADSATNGISAEEIVTATDNNDISYVISPSDAIGDTAIFDITVKEIVREADSGNNANVTSSCGALDDAAIIDLSVDEQRMLCIDISEEGTTEELTTEVLREPVENPPVTSCNIENTETIDISDDEIIPDPPEIATNDDMDEGEPEEQHAETADLDNTPSLLTPMKEYECKVCHLAFQRNENVLSHLMKIHQKNVELKCLVGSCNRKFRNQFNFENHIIGHTRQNTLITADIVKAINVISEEVQLADEQRIEVFGPCYCKICSFTFLNRNSFERHLENHRKYYKCEKCERFLETPARLVIHSMRKHDKITTPKCRYCGLTFKYFNSLAKHLFYAHSDSLNSPNLPIDANIRPEMWQCDLCKKEFYLKKSLEQHLLTHLKSKNKQSGLKSIHRHEGTRINPQISEWDECILMDNFDELLDESVSLNSTGELNYACKLCDFKCSEITMATFHISENHMKYLYNLASNKFQVVNKTRNWNVSFNNPLACNFCNKIIDEKLGHQGLYEHVQRVHNGISCNSCSLTFKEDFLFHAHYLEHYRSGSKSCTPNNQTLTENLYKFLSEKTFFDEGNDSYLCLICGSKHNDMNQLYKHVRTHICKIKKISILPSCKICNMKFLSTRELHDHQKVHSETQRGHKFKCSHCVKRFKLRRGLSDHERRVHGMHAKCNTPSETSDSDQENSSETRDSDPEYFGSSKRPYRSTRANAKYVENTCSSDE